MSDVENRLKEIEIENYIWLLYIGIIILSWYSNCKEKDYILNHNEDSKRIYRNILIFIFLILLFVYTYFVVDSYKSIINLKETDSDIKKKLTYLSFLASVLILASGIIFFYIALKDKNIDTEIAFN